MLVLVAAMDAMAAVKSFWPGQVLSKTEIARKWGKAPLDKSKFKAGSEDERAKMAFSILENKKEFIGVDSTEIRKVLGDFDGFYFRDSIPTYVIHVANNDTDSSWQLVFLVDGNFKVSDVIVQKNCCE